MTDRTFGVEIECAPGCSYNELCSGLIDAFGYDAETWNIYPDGSGYEIHTPVLKGEEGHEFLSKLMQWIEYGGGYVTEEDGMHVHFGCNDLIADKRWFARIIRSWINTESAINKFIVPYRRGNYWACSDFVPPEPNPNDYQMYNTNDKARILERRARIIQDVKDLPKKLRKGEDVYPNTLYRSKLNLRQAASYAASGEVPNRPETIEIRSHEGTLDSSEASAWIRMLDQFFEYHRERPSLPVLGRPTTFLERIGVDDNTATILLRKAELLEKNRRMYGDEYIDGEYIDDESGYWD